MTFSSDVREEVAHLPIERACCRATFLAAALRGAGSLHLTGGGRMHGEVDVGSHAVGRRLLVTLREEGATCGVRAYTPERLGASQRVLLVLSEDAASTAALQRAGVIDADGRPQPFVDEGLLQRSCCRVTALRGAFAVGGTVSPPGRAPLLELRTHDLAFANVLAKCAASMEIPLRVRERPRWAEVMTRQRGAVQDLLTVIGAESAALDVAEDDVVRSARADANRRANFDTANLSRQVLAARSQLHAIAVLHEAGALSSLPVVLRGTAQLRLDNPELTLAELAIAGNVARPTLAARLRRLIAEAETLA